MPYNIRSITYTVNYWLFKITKTVDFVAVIWYLSFAHGWHKITKTVDLPGYGHMTPVYIEDSEAEGGKDVVDEEGCGESGVDEHGAGPSRGF